MKKNSTEDSLYISYGGNFKSASDLGIVEGRAIYFGSPNETDQTSLKDYFDETTYVHPLDEFVTPLFFEHGYEDFNDPIGYATVSKKSDGWYAKAELNMELPIVQEKFGNIKNLEYGFSSGSAGHVVKRKKKGQANHIYQWPFAELSIVKHPAEKNALIYNVKSIDDYYLDDTEMTPPENELNTDTLMKVIEMLISQLTQKHIEDFLIPELTEIKTQLLELKESNSLPNGSTNDEELTVLKSKIEELTSTNEELQSSFNEKEALLSEKMVLLSETQAELETKSQELVTLEEALNSVKSEKDELTTKLEIQKRANTLLTKQTFKI